MKYTEKQIAALVLEYTMDEKNHALAVPNYTYLYPWEGDVFSMTNSLFIHEFEIKRTRSDYKADFKKLIKHKVLESGHYSGWSRRPNYFWFVTCGFDIEPPDYAGWIVVEMGQGVKWIDDLRHVYKRPVLTVKKNAPRLHSSKIDPKMIKNLQRNLSYKLKNLYLRSFLDLPLKQKEK